MDDKGGGVSFGRCHGETLRRGTFLSESAVSGAGTPLKPPCCCNPGVRIGEISIGRRQLTIAGVVSRHEMCIRGVLVVLPTPFLLELHALHPLDGLFLFDTLLFASLEDLLVLYTKFAAANVKAVESGDDGIGFL